MKEPDSFEEMVNGNGVAAGSMTVNEVTGLINLFNAQLLAMEGRLVVKMDDNSRLASERWVRHDAELEKNTLRIVARFESVEKSILIIESSLSDHLKKEHDEEIATEARVKPIKGTVAWFWRNWRDLVLLFIGLFALATFMVETFGRIIGPHAP